MAKSLRSKKKQANKRVMREKAKTIDLQRHDELAQKMHQSTESFNMSRISTLRKNLYKKDKAADANAAGGDVEMETEKPSIYKKILGINKTIEKPKRSVVGPAYTTPTQPSRGTEFLKRDKAPYRPRQYQRSINRLPKYDPNAPKTTETTTNTDDSMEDGSEKTDEQKKYQADVTFMENYHKNLKEHREKLRDLCPPATLYLLSATDRFLEEEKKAKEFALEHYKTKGSKAAPPKSTDNFSEQRKHEILLTADEKDKAAVLTGAEALSFYQRESDGSTMIDDVKVYLPAGYGRFGFEAPQDIFVRHLNDVVESLKRAADHKIRYGLFRKQHEKEFNEKIAETKKRVVEYQKTHKISKNATAEEKRAKPLGLLMRERINKMRGDFMNKNKSKVDNSSLRNASIQRVAQEKNRAQSREGNKIQKTIKKLNTGVKHKYGREVNNIDKAAKRFIDKEFATAMATRNIMYGSQ